MTSTSRPASLPALTGLRFFAAFTVVAFHFAPLPALSGSDAGSAAVTLFFLLSGFILTYTASPGCPRFRVFYVARVARIYPAYLVGLFLGAMLWQTPSYWCPAPRSALVPDLALLQAWFPTKAVCIDGPAWSLSCEAFFYLLFPLLLPLMRLIPVRRLGLALVMLWALALLPPIAFLAVHPTGQAECLWVQTIHLSPALRVLDFLFGMLLGRLYLAGVRVPRPTMGLVLALRWMPVVQFGVGLWGPLDDVLLWPAFALGLLALAQDGHTASRLLSRPWIVTLGEASYGLYILHLPLGIWLDRIVDLSANPQVDVFGLAQWTSWLYFAAFAALMIALSLLSLRFVETPARRAIRAALAPAAVERTVPGSVAAC